MTPAERKPLHTAPDIPAADLTPEEAATPPINAAPTKPDAEKTPEELRAEIDQTRHELGDTVEALAEKTDVKARASEKVDQTKAQAELKAAEVQARVKRNPAPYAGAALALVAVVVIWRRRARGRR